MTSPLLAPGRTRSGRLPGRSSSWELDAFTRPSPDHQSIREYYRSLKQFSSLAATHEGAVSAASATVLRPCAKTFEWTLIPQFAYAAAAAIAARRRRTRAPMATGSTESEALAVPRRGQ